MFAIQNLNHQISGPPTGRKWVFIHGLMGFLNNWKKITGSLDSTEQCLLYDQRGHGRSFKPEKGYSPEDYAQDLRDLAAELGWNRFHLVGHSMGGRNALVFASRFPEMVERLIIEDIGPESSDSVLPYYEDLLGVVPTPFPSREAARQFFQTEFAQKARTKEPVHVIGAFLHANLQENPQGEWDWRFSKRGILETVREGRLKDRWNEVKNLKMPTLWMRGENSKELSTEVFQKVLSSNKLIQGVEVPGAGHWIHSERPEEFLKQIKNFVGGF